MTNSYVNDFGTCVRTYYTELKKCKPLTREKERELILKAKMGDEKARDRVLSSNLKFVFSVASKYKGKGADLPDLISEGNLGLMKAMEKFDTEKDVKFISYAVWWVRNSIQEFIKKRQLISQIEEDDDELFRPIERREIIDEYEDEDDVTICEVLTEDEFDDDAMDKAQKKMVSQILSVLDKRERTIIESYYGIGGKKEMNLEEIGHVLGITKERVRQIKENGLRKLRSEALMMDVSELLFT